MALEGIQSSLQEIAQSVVPHPSGSSCPAIIPCPLTHPACDLPACASVQPLQAMSSSGLGRQSTGCPECCPTKRGHLAADDMEDAEVSMEVDEGLAGVMEIQ